MTERIGFSAVVFPEGKTYTSWCPELDVASQGKSMKNALSNLREALALHLKCLPKNELAKLEKKSAHRLVTTLEILAPC